MKVFVSVDMEGISGDDMRSNLDALPEFEIRGDHTVCTVAPDMDQGFRRIAYLGYADRPGTIRY